MKQTFFSGAKLQKGQGEQSGTQEVPPEHEDKLGSHEIPEHCSRLPLWGAQFYSSP